MNFFKNKKNEEEVAPLYPLNLNQAELFKINSDFEKPSSNTYFFTAFSQENESLSFRLKYYNENCEYTVIYQNNNHCFFESGYSSTENCPITLRCFEIGKSWGIDYYGNLKSINENNNPPNVDIAFTGMFLGDSLIDNSINVKSHSDIIHSNSGYRVHKNTLNQIQNENISYSQKGNLIGTLHLGNLKKDITFSSVRIHSFGSTETQKCNGNFTMLAFLENNEVFSLTLKSYQNVTRIDHVDLYRIDDILHAIKIDYETEMFKDLALPDLINSNIILENYENLLLECSVSNRIDVETIKNDSVTLNICTIKINGVKGYGILDYVLGETSQNLKQIKFITEKK